MLLIKHLGAKNYVLEIRVFLLIMGFQKGLSLRDRMFASCIRLIKVKIPTYAFQ